MIMMQMEIRRAHRRPTHPAREPPSQSCAKPNKIYSVKTISTEMDWRLTCHGPGNRRNKTRFIGIDVVVVNKLFVRQNDSHDSSIVAIESSTEDHAIQQ